MIFGVFDADRAGNEAAERFRTTLGERWLPIALPEGEDLNDVGRRPGGRGLFFRLVADARGSRASEVRKDDACANT